ncbi:hypothetical protein A3SI_11219 [Nitritalea halalkaliphila LW7]|uniref:Uncharacterized protein n=1 Tax=Nitritalea halalkaliphila LW7 TaxID=1189621 RepID=I5C295_9BACT|nr:hypothetical protein [Nitritalea halalkaliphila]EIM75947.1 hypothetical protein A3SI_11219 [Nitritalea halalkaliphila LW7]
MIDQLEEWLPKALRYDIYSTVAILLAVWLLKKVAYTLLERNVKDVEMRKVFHYKKNDPVYLRDCRALADRKYLDN